MNYNFYTPVILSKDLFENKPVRIIYRTKAVVLLRTEKGVFAYDDFCPHRGLALSEGIVHNGQLHCKYHGWQFDCENGENTFVPVKNKAIPCKLKSFFVEIAYDLIWLSESEDAIIPELSNKIPAIILKGNIQAQLVNTLENFLEGSHTHFVHDGLIRSKKVERHPIKAQIENNENGFKVTYESEPAKGLITKLLPKKIQHLNSVSTYIHPGIAVLEFFNPKKEIVARFEAIMKEEKESINYFARIFLNIGMLTKIVRPFAKMTFKKVIQQDKDILEKQEQNLSHFDNHSFISDETDIVGKYIYAWCNKHEHKLNKKESFIVYW